MSKPRARSHSRFSNSASRGSGRRKTWRRSSWRSAARPPRDSALHQARSAPNSMGSDMRRPTTTRPRSHAMVSLPTRSPRTSISTSPPSSSVLSRKDMTSDLARGDEGLHRDEATRSGVALHARSCLTEGMLDHGASNSSSARIVSSPSARPSQAGKGGGVPERRDHQSSGDPNELARDACEFTPVF